MSAGANPSLAKGASCTMPAVCGSVSDTLIGFHLEAGGTGRGVARLEAPKGVELASEKVFACSELPSDLTFLLADDGVINATFAAGAPRLDADHLPSTAITFFVSRLAIALGPVGGTVSERGPFASLGMVEGRIPSGFCKGSTGAA
jgi:hypothetical protein